MLSRRGIRIKAMQAIYMVLQSSGSIDKKSAEKLLNQAINNAFQSYLYCIYFITQIALQVDLEAHRRKNKYLPKEEDLKFSSKLFTNPVIQFFNNNKFFQDQLKKEKLLTMTDEEIIPVIYTQLKEFTPYKEYVQSDDDSIEAHKLIIKKIMHEFLCLNEYFDQHMEDVIPTWADDEFIAKGLIDDVLDKLPFSEIRDQYFFTFSLSSDEEDFALTLLDKTISEKDHYDTIIQPKLQNWELDRIGLLDSILMKMAITEFLYLPTIPIKVTMNEYLDISKIYSTPRSREFINGVLDKIMYDMKQNGEIVKTGRGLIQ